MSKDDFFDFDEKLSDVAAERCVLTAICKYGKDFWLEIAEFTQSTTFTEETNQQFFSILINLLDKNGVSNIDISSITSSASELGLLWLLDKPDEARHIRSILNGSVDFDNALVWAVKIRKLEITRLLKKQLIDANRKLNDVTGNEALDSILGIAENAIFDFSSLINTTSNENPSLLSDELEDWLTYVEENPCEIIGISSGWKKYDLAIGGGFRRKTVSLIGARTGVGKSVTSVNIGLHVAGKTNIPVLYLDTEMCREDHWPRVLSNLCHQSGQKINITEIETGKYGKYVKKKNSVREAQVKLSKMPFFYKNVSGKSFESVLSIMRRWIHQHVKFNDNGVMNPCLIIYDYVKLMSGDSLANMQEYQALGFLMTSMHNFAVKNDVPILSLIQLNRDGIDKESTDVVSGSDRIVWLTTNFAIFKAKSPEEIAADGPENGNRKLVILKSRHGGLADNDYINMTMHGEFCRIIENKTKYELKVERNRPPDPNINLDDDDDNKQ